MPAQYLQASVVDDLYVESTQQRPEVRNSSLYSAQPRSLHLKTETESSI
jgi:hypothetical protein